REIRTKLRLFRIRSHGQAAHRMRDSTLGSCEERHDDERQAGERDSWHTRFWWRAGYQVADSCPTHVRREGEKTDADRPQCQPFDPLTAMFICVHRHSPEQRCSRAHLNKAIDAESDQRNAASER